MVSIKLLKDHMHHIPALADIWCAELGNKWIPHVTRKEVQSWMINWDKTDSLPVAHIALYKNQPIGICSLQKNDGIRSDLWPWLADLCVAKDFQKHGVGQQLVEATKNKAHELGYDNLYLFIFDHNLKTYYERFGFFVIGQDRHRNHPVMVMQTKLP